MREDPQVSINISRKIPANVRNGQFGSVRVEAVGLSFVRHWSVQEGEGRSPDRTWQEDQRQALTPAVILFIVLPSTEDKSESG